MVRIAQLYMPHIGLRYSVRTRPGVLAEQSVGASKEGRLLRGVVMAVVGSLFSSAPDLAGPGCVA